MLLLLLLGESVEIVSWADEMDRRVFAVVILFLMMVDRAVLLRKQRDRND